ncbi:MAG: hypothetical protein WBL67_22285 [Nitrososphaeraceae archaeon]
MHFVKDASQRGFTDVNNGRFHTDEFLGRVTPRTEESARTLPFSAFATINILR